MRPAQRPHADPGAGALLALVWGCMGCTMDKGRFFGDSGPTDSGEADPGRQDGYDGFDGFDGADGSDGGDGWGGTDGTLDVGDPVDEVCYPGSAADGPACLPVYAWDETWGSDYTYPEPLDERYPAPVRFIDLAGDDANPDLPLAENFVLGELMQEYKGRFALYQPHALISLQSVRDAVGGPVNVNSGYRSPGYNAGIEGSATWSRHMYGDAADISASSLSIDALADLCEAAGASYVGTYTSHVHCDWRDEALEPAFFEEDDAGAAPPAADHAGPADGLDATIERRDRGGLSARTAGFTEGQPLLTWTARGAEDAVLQRHQGADFEPPAGTVTVELDVGRQLTRTLRLSGG